MKRGGLTYANVVSTICLVLLVGGGTAIAAGGLAKNSVGTRQLKSGAVTAAKIKNGSVTGAKVDLASLGTVPSAATATTAGTAAKATSAETAAKAGSAETAVTAATATNAAHASQADDAAALGGTPASGFAKSELEPVHVVGRAGQPPFEWTCEDGTFAPAGFYKDPFGIVHLVGEFAGCAESAAIFILPPDLRPLEVERFVILAKDGTVGTVRVDTDGTVDIFATTRGSFGGISFRTD